MLASCRDQPIITAVAQPPLRIYDLRSGILHRSDLTPLDQGRAFGREPPWFNEQEINTELWSLMRTAARNAKLTKPRVEARQIAVR